ncbi:ABC transporter A family member 1 [Diplonema papillatum]|nr:ABC transporter A family member 1 [Diplonema papillatum]
MSEGLELDTVNTPMSHHHVDHHVDLSQYAMSHRGLKHFGIAMRKNAMIKSRKPRALACEIFGPPLFMAALLIGYYAASDEYYPAQNYAANDPISSTELSDVFCTTGVPSTVSSFQECERFWINISYVKPPPNAIGWGNESSLGAVLATYDWLNDLLNAGGIPLEPPSLSTMIALQRMATYAIPAPDVNTATPLNALLHGGFIEFVGGSCEQVQDIISYLRGASFLFDTCFDDTVDRNNEACPEQWPNEDAAIDYIKGSRGADNTWVLIKLNRLDPTDNVFDYTLRLNYTSTPYTLRTKARFTVAGLGDNSSLQYTLSGFITLQNLLDQYFLDTINVPHNAEVLSTPMPTDSYVENQFYQAAGGLIPLILALSFLYPVSCLVGGIVEEKEQRLREGMLIMGLSKKSFYSSWYCTYLVVMTTSNVLITVLAAPTFLSHTSALLIFVLYELFAMSIIAMSLLLSVFFSKARIAAIAAPLLMFITVVPKFMIPDNSPLGMDVLFSVLSPVAFSYSTELLTSYETAGRGSSFADLFADEYPYFLAMFMMMLDTVLYLFLFWYLDQVLPSEFGVKRSPFFLCTPGYWMGKPTHPPHDGHLPTVRPQHVDTDYVSTTRDELKLKEGVRIMGLTKQFTSADGKQLLAVDSLGNGLPQGSLGDGAMTFYEGQIQCVLGHNGAGKTTLINLMTGMLPPTAGDCEIWGKSIATDIDTIRQDIGFCPQHNILWPRLTVIEHLAFYGQLKGVPAKVLHGEKGHPGRIEQMLRLVNLYEKRNAWSQVLSGGQKRKLSVACSLIGGAKLVFLDEPTAGMDVESRRAMWSLLRDPAVLKDRIIVLTTHYMDEADLLGDSIAIMHKGCLHSWGSSFYLKSKMGVGYNMSIAMAAGCDPERIERLIAEKLPLAGVSRMSCTGNELRLRLPMDSQPSDSIKESITSSPNTKRKEGLVEALNASATALREYVVRMQHEGELTDAEQKLYVEILKDVRTTRLFPTVFGAIDAQKDELKIHGYGVSVTTLEEIFMKIALEAETLSEHLSPPPSPGNPSSINSPQAVPPASANKEPKANFSQLYSILDHKDRPQEDVALKGVPLYTAQFYSLLLKRVHCGRRDKRTLCFQFIMPVVFIGIALLLGKLGPPAMPEMVLDPAEQFDTPTFMPFAPAHSTDFFNSTVFGSKDYALHSSPAWNNSITLSTYLLETISDHKHEDRVGAFIYPDTVNPPGSVINNTMSILANTTWLHAYPTLLNSFHNALMHQTGATGTIMTRNHPFPMSDYEQKVISSISVVIVGIFIMIPFTFIPSNFVSFVVKERECKAKHVQVVSGVHVVAYWMSSLVFDILSYCLTLVLAYTLFFLDNRKELIGGWDVFSASFILFFLYGLSTITNSYLLSFLFTSHTAAQNAVMIFNFIAGFILVIAAQILGFIDSAKDANHVLKYFYRLVPSYCLGEGIINLSTRDLIETLDLKDETPSPYDWDVIGVSCTYMAVMAPTYLALTFLIEWSAFRQVVANSTWYNFKALFRKTRPQYLGMDAGEDQPLVARPPTYDADADADSKLESDGPSVKRRRGGWLECVDDHQAGLFYYFNEVTGESKWSSRDTPFYADESVEEEARIVSEGMGRVGDYVTVQRLRKVWPPAGNMSRPKVAVHDLSFGVKSGELFAFLGTNGAGKTTTLSVLSGEYPPSAGRAFIGQNPETGHGYDVVHDAQLARQSLGFCPQFDACLDNLTVQEHLQFFAALRGVPKKHVTPSIELLLEGLDLAPHRAKTSKSLSGGNRRKLSVAIALMGGPPVIFLDEPSAGMDPLARRSLWVALEKAITDLQLSVVLTTHHLEEIEGLARLEHRVTIMVDGKLQCLGSLQQLKHALGDTYELIVKVASAEAEEKVKKLVQQTWRNAELTECTQHRLTYQVAKKDLSLAHIFQVIEDNRSLGITDYSINETSLEQVFMRISERAMRDEDVEAYKVGAGSDRAKLYLPAPPGKEVKAVSVAVHD